MDEHLFFTVDSLNEPRVNIMNPAVINMMRCPANTYADSKHFFLEMPIVGALIVNAIGGGRYEIGQKTIDGVAECVLQSPFAKILNTASTIEEFINNVIREFMPPLHNRGVTLEIGLLPQPIAEEIIDHIDEANC